MHSKILTTLVFLAGVGASCADAAPLIVYWTTNAAVSGGAPPGAGAGAWNAGGAVGPIPAGGTFWVAFLNTARPELRKYVRIEISKADGTLPKIHREDFDGFDAAGNTVPKKNTAAGFGGGVRRHEYRFGPPQPLWERFEYESREAVPTTFDFEGWSACCKTRPPGGIKDFAIDEGYFGATGAMAGPQQITSILVFPSSNSVNTSIAPTFSFPPASGTWTAQFVNVDPDGNPRPRGGVRWSTTGAGLGPDVLFSTGFKMNEIQEDLRYDLYAFDSATGQYEGHLLDLASGNVPSLGFYGLICLVALLMGGGVLVLRRN